MAKIRITIMAELVKNSNKDYRLMPEKMLYDYIKKRFKCSSYMTKKVISEINTKTNDTTN